MRYVWSNAKNVTNKCFATEQKDSSMSPIIPIDSLLIIDPSKEARDGDYILLLVGKNILLRRYLDAGDTKYYELLNPKFDGIKKEMTKKNRILGVTISVELKL
ncbi:S24 family peptidase [Piscirickettsia salmonis]|uniref:S24 family peptidase n=1 Tax=Piscirickettsia salmonis TaxID=1238 RepID=UPI00249EF284|nr:S24 family peptidase [Piscirickettsia salmonis]